MELFVGLVGLALCILAAGYLFSGEPIIKIEINKTYKGKCEDD